jgi:hypothetical protein
MGRPGAHAAVGVAEGREGTVGSINFLEVFHMRSVIVVACLLGLVATTSVAAPSKVKEKPKTVLEKIQGKWLRKNHEYSFLIDGNKWTEFSDAKFAKPNATGPIETPPGKDFAMVKTDNGAVIYLFPAGENALAVETIVNDAVWGDGRVFYRPGFAP